MHGSAILVTARRRHDLAVSKHGGMQVGVAVVALLVLSCSSSSWLSIFGRPELDNSENSCEDASLR